MGKISEYLSIGLSLVAILFGVSMVREEKRTQEEEQIERNRITEKYNKTEYFRQPMVWNGGSLEVGYLLKDAYVYLDAESEEISYSLDYDTQKDGLRAFDSLFVEICKHHCDSLAPHVFTNEYNRVFECNHPGASITLRYRGEYHEWKGKLTDWSDIEITYSVPHKIGHGVGERWQQYLVVD